MQLPTLADIRIPKAAALAGGALVALLVVLAVAVPYMLDGTRQGQAVASQFAMATGQRVTIEGGVEVSILPTPRLVINRLKLISVATNTTLLSAPRVELEVGYASLLSGTYNVDEVTLVRPLLTLLADGSVWSPNLAALSVSRLRIQNGTLDIARSSQPERVTDINGNITLPVNTARLRADLAGDWRGAPIKLAFDINPPQGGNNPVGFLKFDVGAAEASLGLLGKFDLFSKTPQVNADLSLIAGQAGSLWALLNSLGLPISVPDDAGLRQPLSLQARLATSDDAYDLSNATLRLGNWQASGLARFVKGPEGGLSLAIKSDVVDMALWPTLVRWAQEGTMGLPTHLLGAFDLQLAGLSYGQFRAAPVLVKGDFKNGTLRVANAVAMLPGDARVQFNGSLATKAGAPALLDGKLEFEGLRLRETMAGLGLTLPPDLDDTALRQLKLAADLRGPWTGWAMPNLETTLDGIHMTGQIGARSESGVVDANFNIDQFDLDKYAQTQAVPAWLWQLPPANVSVTFRQLRAAGKMAENVTLTAALAPNLLTIKGLDAADFGGNTVRLSGTLSPDSSQDSDITLRLTTPDYAQLRQGFAPVGRLLPEALASQVSGPVDMSVRLRRAVGEQQQLYSLNLRDGRLDLVMTTKPDQPLAFKLRVQNRETANLLRQLVPEALARPDAVLGATDFYLEGIQAQPEGWQLTSLQGQLAGLTVRAGNISVIPGQPVNVSGSLTLSSVNVDLWRQTLNPASLLGRVAANLDLTVERLSVAGHQIDDASGQVRLSPPAVVALSNFTGTWQEGKLTANGELTLAPQLAVKGSLEVHEANVSLRGGNRYGVSGMLDMAVRLDGQGATLPALVSALSGDGEFSMDSGELSGADFAALTEALQDRRNRANRNVNALLARGGTTALSAFGGDFVIDEGKVQASQLRLRTPSASAEVKAEMDLSGPRLDAEAKISLREIDKAPPFTLSLTGPLGNLEGNFETAELAQFLQPAPAPIPAPTSASNAEAAQADKPAAASKPDDTAKPASNKPQQQRKPQDSKPAATSADKPQAPSPTAQALALMPPEEPVPPAAESGAAAVPPASPDELAAMPRTAPRDASAAAPASKPEPEAAPSRPQRTSNINRNRRPAATAQPSASAPASPASTSTSAQASPAGAPPSISELLSVAPATQAPAAAASAPDTSVSSDTPTGISGAAPRVRMVPIPTKDNAIPGLAPEFADEKPAPVREQVRTTPTGAREIKENGLTIRLPAEDDEGDSGYVPAANVGDLMNRVTGE